MFSFAAWLDYLGSVADSKQSGRKGEELAGFRWVFPIRGVESRTQILTHGWVEPNQRNAEFHGYEIEIVDDRQRRRYQLESRYIWSLDAGLHRESPQGTDTQGSPRNPCLK